MCYYSLKLIRHLTKTGTTNHVSVARISCTSTSTVCFHLLLIYKNHKK
eukprot:UN00857